MCVNKWVDLITRGNIYIKGNLQYEEQKKMTHWLCTLGLVHRSPRGFSADQEVIIIKIKNYKITFLNLGLRVTKYTFLIRYKKKIYLS